MQKTLRRYHWYLSHSNYLSSVGDLPISAFFTYRVLLNFNNLIIQHNSKFYVSNCVEPKRSRPHVHSLLLMIAYFLTPGHALAA